MAEIAIFAAKAVLKQTILVLGNLAVQEGCRMSKLKEDMEWIENEMSYIQAYLEDVDDANGEQSESRVEATLLTNIRVLAFDVEDFVETYFPRIGSLYERTGCLGSCLKSATCVLCHGFAIHNLVVEIEAIRRRVENIARVRNAYGTNNSTNNSGRNIWEKRRHFLHHDEPIVVGFDEHIKTLMARVIDPDLKRHVVSIVGMPGLGKTTLAKKVFDSVVNDDDYNFHHRFQCSAKVYASQRPNVKHLLQDIAKQVGLAKEKWEENVEANLSAYLKGKRYVILIDDIWDTQTWDDLENGIPKNCKNGSRIIITSRNREVGLSICGVSFLYELQPLKPNESWNLFSMMVMDPLEITTDTIEFQELEPLGRKIVERCGFVPLAIVVVAGLLLRKEKTEHAWKGVLDNMGQDDDMCSKILALSYKDLPIHLKPCFLYFGLFPEDYEIFAFELINLWAAEGFVQEKGQRTPEDVGEDYLDHLVARNMVQVARRRYDGRIRTCRIHDLLHSLCIRVATECNFFNPHNDVTAINSAQKVRRVTNYRNSVREYISSNLQTPKLRTMLSFLGKDWSSPSRKQVKEFFKGSRFLRVLSVDGHGFSFPLPNEIASRLSSHGQQM
ncbi:disease resistance protein RPP13-like [Camellia sinensis]|uniref:disease resistance protein RPP13-like n=1 Tax=Camellia sinensis TaxID=4442 RepID=UPI001036C5BA|nr:disease resistance protein RPP13-like [Camellia sinensis]